MPLNFKHINANEQILDGSIGTSLLADGSVTAAKLAFGAITSSNLLVDSNIDFNNFQALQFRIENLNFFPVAGNPGRLIWRTDLKDIFVDSDFTLNIVSLASIPLQIGIITDATHMSVNSTTGLSVGDAIIQGGFPFAQVEILATIDTTHLVVASTAGIIPGYVLVQANATSVVTGIIDATHLTVANTNGFQPDVATVSTPYVVAIIQTIVDATHLVVDSTAGFVGKAIVSVDFGIVSVDDSTHLTVDNSTAMSAGDVITQGLTSTVITSVTDLTHIIVASTAGLGVGIAIVKAPVDVLSIPDATHLVVTSTAGFGPGDPVNQGAASTTIVSVIDLTHIQVGSTTGFATNAAKDSTITVDSTANTSIGMYLNQQTASTVIIEIPDATHLAVADTTGFVPGPAFSGNWVSINEGANVTSVFSDNNPHLHGDIQFLSGTNTHLPQLGQTITVNVPAAGVTGNVQFNLNAQNDFGADPNLFWDNINKRLGINTNTPVSPLQVIGDVNVNDTTAGNNGVFLGASTGIVESFTSNGNDITASASSTAITITGGSGTGNDPSINFIPENSTPLAYVIQGSHLTGQLDFLAEGLAGQKVLTLTQTGRVGVNNATPATALDVVGDISIESSNVIFNSDSTQFIYWYDAAHTVAKGSINLNPDSSVIISGSSAQFVKIDSNNTLFGIGTTSPAAMLDVAGPVAIRNVANTSGHGDLTFYNDSPSETHIEARSSDGTQVFGNLFLGNIGGGGFELQSNVGAGSISVATSGSIRTWNYNLDGSFNSPVSASVGYGNNPFAPAATLDINGTGHFVNDLTVDTKISVDLVKGRTGNLALQPLTDGGHGTQSIQLQNASGTPILSLSTWDGQLSLNDGGNGQAVEFSMSTDNGSILIFNNAAQTVSSQIYSPDATQLLLRTNNNANTWTFDSAGVLTTPGNIVVPSADIIIKSAPSAANGLTFWGEQNEDENGQIDFYTHDGSQFLGEISGWLHANSVFNGNPFNVIQLDTVDSFKGSSSAIQSHIVFLTRDAIGTTYEWGINEVGTFSNVPQSVATDLSAALQLDSTTRGFLLPRMTTAQRDAIVSPAPALQIYNTDTNLLQLWNGTAWVTVGQAVFQQDIFNVAGPGNVFTLTFTPIPNSQVVYYNGLALAPGVSEDYTISGNVVTLNGSIVLANGDKILIVYSHY